MSILFKRVLLFLFMLSFSWAKGEEQQKQAIEIKSTTMEHSAGINISMEEGKQISEKDKENDKKRKTLGIGEEVNLILTGKPYFYENDALVTWSVSAGENLGTVEKISNTSAKLTIYPYASQEGQIKVKAVSDKGEETELGFSVKIPTGLIAKHSRKSYNPEDEDFGKNGISPYIRNLCPNCKNCPICKGQKKCPRCRACSYAQCRIINLEGNSEFAGAIATLEVTIEPTTVNFSKILIKEYDLGSVPKEGVPQHTPSPAHAISNKNRFFDNIGYYVDAGLCQGLPWSWLWKCEFYLYFQGQPIKIIGNRLFMDFKVEQIGQNVKSTIKKFNCTVTRITGGNHLYE